MKCHEVETWMLTDETPNRPSAEVRSHLRSCAACRRNFGRLVRLIHEVSNAPLPPVPAAAREKLLSSLEPRPAVLPMAVPVQPVSRPKRWQTQPWMRWSAAAVLFLGLGLGLALLVRPARQPSAPVAQGPVEDRVLARHLVLSETNEPTKRLTALNDMATDVRDESLASARTGAREDLEFLVWLHARILHEGVLRGARDLPENSRTTVTPILRQLQKAEQNVSELVQVVPLESASSLRELGQQMHETIAALQGGPDSTPPAVKPPTIVTKRNLLQVLVVSSLEMAREEDPVKRAEQSTEVAGRLADTLMEQADKGGTEETNRLAESIQKVMERGVQGNLDKLDLDRVDEARQKQIDRLQERAGAAMQKVQPNIQRMPPAAQQNLLRALELAKQKLSKSKPPPRKPHGSRSSKPH
jgi:hypothetical protein